ncbi:hypothetical protein ACE1TI_21690 [Alteribacillus sp. JSM 102045]|uniref:hypothetical protein n=1 Tax=Alteribacillus sp. JSM 102045 TaxID=1562101 RepID=UPI0035C104D9
MKKFCMFSFLLTFVILLGGNSVYAVDDYELKFRDTFGLSKESSPNKNSSSTAKYGLNLTEEEEKDLDFRMEIQNKYIPEIVKALEKSTKVKEKIGGMYINQENGGIFTILIKEDDVENVIRNTVKEVFPYEEEYLDIKIVDYSEEELNNYQDKLYELESTLKKQGIRINPLNLDTYSIYLA